MNITIITLNITHNHNYNIRNTITDMTDTNYERYAFLPIQNHKLIEFYHSQKNCFWTPQELHLEHDRKQFTSLPPNTQEFIKYVLCFFAQADGIISDNLMHHFQAETSHIKEAAAFYAMQNCMETIHNETYSLLIEALITDPFEKQKAFNAIAHYPCIKMMSDWMIEWMNSDKSLCERVIAVACVEGIFFNGAFCAIYWLKRQNLLPGLCRANELIARDEAIHTNFAVSLYHTLVNMNLEMNVSQETVHSIIRSAVMCCESFIRDALKVDLIGMKTDDMIQYIQVTADHLIQAFGYDKIYNQSNPFQWMIMIGLQNKTNFFEHTVTTYEKVNETSEFDLDAEF